MTFDCLDALALKVPTETSNIETQGSEEQISTNDFSFIKSASANFLLPFEVDDVLIKLQQK
jgi:hypothetical protein